MTYVFHQKAPIFFIFLFTKPQPGNFEPQDIRKNLTGKPTNREHPESLKSSIPFVKALRRTCTTQDDFDKNYKLVETKLKESSYNEQEIREIVIKTRNSNRNQGCST